MKVNKHTPPTCCGQPARYVVQGMTLQYWFCDVCRQEPSATVVHPVLEVVNTESTMASDVDYSYDIWFDVLKGIP